MALLIKNNHQMHWTLDLSLEFDDGTSKSTTLDSDMYILIKFRRNDNTYIRAGRIVEVSPVMLDTQPVSFTGSIIVDFSGSYNASRIAIPACDILNIRVCSKSQLETFAPTYKIEEKMFDESYIIPSNTMLGGFGVGLSGVEIAKVY